MRVSSRVRSFPRAAPSWELTMSASQSDPLRRWFDTTRTLTHIPAHTFLRLAILRVPLYHLRITISTPSQPVTSPTSSLSHYQPQVCPASRIMQDGFARVSFSEVYVGE